MVKSALIYFKWTSSSSRKRGSSVFIQKLDPRFARTTLNFFFGKELFLIFVSFIFVNTVFADTQKPQRIASLNLCVDAILIKLVEPERINSLTYLSSNKNFSPFAEQAKHFYLNHGLAEELVPRNPDLILAGEFGATDAKNLLHQLGFRVETLSNPRNLLEIDQYLEQFGKLTGSEVAANQLRKNIREKLDDLDQLEKTHVKKISAFWYSSNGVVIGAGTLEDELMQRAGFRNLAREKNIQGFAHLELEDLILAKPQVIIMESSDAAAFSLAHEYLTHPALRDQSIQLIQLPPTLSVCSVPVVADVIEQLRLQKQKIAID